MKPHSHLNIEVDPEVKREFVKYCNVPGDAIDVAEAVNKLLGIVNIICITQGSVRKALKELDRYICVVHQEN